MAVRCEPRRGNAEIGGADALHVEYLHRHDRHRGEPLVPTPAHEATADGLGPGPSRHVLLVPDSDQHLWEATSAFAAQGLRDGEQVAYYDDDGTGAQVLDRMVDDGIDVDGFSRTGQLQVVPAEATRDALMAPLTALTGLLEGAVDAAVAAGWAGLRFTGNMSHGMERPGGPVLEEYDGVLDRVLADRPGRALCVYDRERFPPWMVDRMHELHRHRVPPAPAVFDDALLRITRGPDRSMRLAGEVDCSNRQQIRRLLMPLLERALRAPSGPTDIVLDVTSLRFCDIAAATSLVHAAEEFPSSHRLLLDGVRPLVGRTLERCGADSAPQLVIRSRRQRVSSTR